MPKYALAFEEHLDPIKKRGKVVLDGAIPEGASIQVIRKTPIETEFLAQALKPLPTEALEHALDKICYIQQEIEGHLCDCRGEDWPPPGVVGPPGEGVPPGGSDAPECQPYTCDAFAAFMSENGWEVADFSDLQGVGDITLPAKFDLYGGGVSEVAPNQPDKIGNVLGYTYYTSQYYLWDMTGEVDACAGVVNGLALGENSLGLPQGHKLSLGNSQGSIAAMLHGGINSSNNGQSLLWRRADYTITHPGGSLPGQKLIGIDWVNAAGFHAYNGSTSVFFGLPSFNAGLNFLFVSAELENIRSEQADGFNPPRYLLVGDMVVKAQVNGVLYERTSTEQLSQGYEGFVSMSGLTWSDTKMFSGMLAKLNVIAGTSGAVDIDDLYNAYLRNQVGYVPPEHCQFSGDEI